VPLEHHRSFPIAESEDQSARVPSRALDVVDDLLPPVQQENSKAFAIMAVPDQMADSFLYQHRHMPEGSPDLKPADAKYGAYYLKIRQRGVSPTGRYEVSIYADPYNSSGAPCTVFNLIQISTSS
jgi:hypothetical protein